MTFKSPLQRPNRSNFWFLSKSVSGKGLHKLLSQLSSYLFLCCSRGKNMVATKIWGCCFKIWGTISFNSLVSSWNLHHFFSLKRTGKKISLYIYIASKKKTPKKKKYKKNYNWYLNSWFPVSCSLDQFSEQHKNPFCPRLLTRILPMYDKRVANWNKRKHLRLSKFKHKKNPEFVHAFYATQVLKMLSICVGDCRLKCYKMFLVAEPFQSIIKLKAKKTP